jgi:hypothetical protein
MTEVRDRGSSIDRPRALGLVLAGVALLSGCSVAPDPATDRAISSAATDAGSGTGLRMLLVFDGEPPGAVTEGAAFRDSSGWGNGAIVRYPESLVVRLEIAEDPDRGGVLVLPAPCAAEDPACLRGILEVDSTPQLDVGDADFSFGAHLKLRRGDLRDGGNVVQKGYSTGGSGQWKLQVDDEEGRPECVLVGTGTDEVLKVKGDRSVTDGQWHAVECRREGRTLELRIDGMPAGRSDAPDPLVITNPDPIRVGGKHTKEGSDPIFGQVDAVFLRVG